MIETLCQDLLVFTVQFLIKYLHGLEIYRLLLFGLDRGNREVDLKPFHRPRSFLKNSREKWDLQMGNTERIQISNVVWIERKHQREWPCV